MRFKIFFVCVICLNLSMWFYARPLQAQWQNVPAAPDKHSASAVGLGDREFAYRIYGLMLQNLGNIDGRTVKLSDYDYAELEKWFISVYSLNQQSNYIPTLAAYYYGATNDREQIKHVLNFLSLAGNKKGGEKWRWLTYAVFLAQHKLGDLDRALQIASLLRTHPDPNVPIWARQMSAMVYNAKGEKEDAYNIMVAILQSSIADLNPTEIRFLVDYICQQILSEEEAGIDPICQ